jgi:hypothetical protein
VGEDEESSIIQGTLPSVSQVAENLKSSAGKNYTIEKTIKKQEKSLGTRENDKIRE